MVVHHFLASCEDLGGSCQSSESCLLVNRPAPRLLPGDTLVSGMGGLAGASTSPPSPARAALVNFPPRPCPLPQNFQQVKCYRMELVCDFARSEQQWVEVGGSTASLRVRRAARPPFQLPRLKSEPGQVPCHLP